MFGMDPWRQQQLAMMMAGMAGGMAGQPRMGGWSAPLGGAARGLAQMFPFMMQMQQQQQERQQQQQAMQQLQQSLKGLPNMQGNPYGPIVQQLSGTPYGAEEALKLIGPMAAWQPPEAKAPTMRTIVRGDKEVQQEFDPRKMNWVDVGTGPRWDPNSGVNVTVKNEGPLPTGKRVIRDKQGNIIEFQDIPGAPKTETEIKGATLLESAMPDYQIAKQNFDALAQTGGQVANTLLPSQAANFFKSDQFRQAENSTANVIQSYIYAVSGQQAPEQEVTRRMKIVMPALNDDAKTIAQKKARLDSMMAGIQVRASGANPKPSRELGDPVGKEANPWADKTDQEILDELRNQGIIQ